MAKLLRKLSRGAGAGSHDDGGESQFSEELLPRSNSDYFGWIYHLGVNKIGRDYCHYRFLCIRGKYVEMYKRDPFENPGIKPIRRGIVGHALVVEEKGRRRVDDCDLYVLCFYNRLDASKKGEIACSTSGETQTWMKAFDQAKQQADYELLNGGHAREKLNMEDEINLEGRRPRVRRYAHELRNFVRIGQGHGTLLRKLSSTSIDKSDNYSAMDGDAIEAHKWKCVWTLRGIRIFEDVADSKNGRYVLVKSVGVIDASADTVFEALSSLDPSKRYEWDILTGDLELIESLDGHYDVLCGTYDPKYFTWWKSKRDFVLSRQWFCDQDGTYTILHFPSTHKKMPPRSGFQRTKITPSTWEIKNLKTQSAIQSSKCLLTHTLEIKCSIWCKWKKRRYSKFEKSTPFAMLCQVAGIREYIAANPSLTQKSDSTIDSEGSFSSFSNCDFDGSGITDEFYDAIATDSPSDSEDSDEGIEVNKVSDPCLNEKLDSTSLSLPIDPKLFRGSLKQEKDGNDKNCWSDPGGLGFMVRGKTYLKDNAKVKGGDPLLKLVAVDWLKAENALDKVALRTSCMVQTDAGRKLPFILVINLQAKNLLDFGFVDAYLTGFFLAHGVIPAKPNYNMVMYYAADRPVQKDSLLEKFVNGTDMFRDSKLKLIPSIVKGYWMVKRAVGTKAFLLGKAVTCNYLRQDNFLEIDVDIGSSSVARGVINLVIGCITSLVVDLAILLEGKEESELPEYLLGTVRLHCIHLDSAEGVRHSTNTNPC